MNRKDEYYLLVSKATNTNTIYKRCNLKEIGDSGQGYYSFKMLSLTEYLNQILCIDKKSFEQIKEINDIYVTVIYGGIHSGKNVKVKFKDVAGLE